jgi:hypothetical protein
MPPAFPLRDRKTANDFPLPSIDLRQIGALADRTGGAIW